MCRNGLQIAYIKTSNVSWSRGETGSNSIELGLLTDGISTEYIRSEIEPGNILIFMHAYNVYQYIGHYAVCVEKNDNEIWVAHDPGQKNDNAIEGVKFERFDDLLSSTEAFIIRKCDPNIKSEQLCRSITVRRAKEWLGDTGYNVVRRNCETVAHDAVPPGHSNSGQVQDFMHNLLRIVMFLLCFVSISWTTISHFNIFQTFLISAIFGYLTSILLTSFITSYFHLGSAWDSQVNKANRFAFFLHVMETILIKKRPMNMNTLKYLEELKTFLLCEMFIEHNSRQHGACSLQLTIKGIKDYLMKTHNMIFQHWVKYYGLAAIIYDRNWDGYVSESHISGLKRLTKYLQQNHIPSTGLTELCIEVLFDYIDPIYNNLIKIADQAGYNKIGMQQQRLWMAIINLYILIQELSAHLTFGVILELNIRPLQEELLQIDLGTEKKLSAKHRWLIHKVCAYLEIIQKQLGSKLPIEYRQNQLLLEKKFADCDLTPTINDRNIVDNHNVPDTVEALENSFSKTGKDEFVSYTMKSVIERGSALKMKSGGVLYKLKLAFLAFNLKHEFSQIPSVIIDDINLIFKGKVRRVFPDN